MNRNCGTHFDGKDARKIKERLASLVGGPLCSQRDQNPGPETSSRGPFCEKPNEKQLSAYEMGGNPFGRIEQRLLIRVMPGDSRAKRDRL